MRLNECYSVPDYIVREITNYDPLVRLRYCRSNGMVRVERKVTCAAPLNPAWFMKWDDYEGAKDGYLMVMEFLPIQENYRKVVYSLYIMDLWKRLGGPKEYADYLDQQDAEKKQKERQDRHENFVYLFKELWRHINTPKTGWQPYLGTGRGESLD